ncbi:MAG: hypothetical protein V7641_2200 [Blastocatellia bacterium]
MIVGRGNHTPPNWNFQYQNLLHLHPPKANLRWTCPRKTGWPYVIAAAIDITELSFMISVLFALSLKICRKSLTAKW